MMRIENETSTTREKMRDPDDIIHSQFFFKVKMEWIQGQAASELLSWVTMKLNMKGHGRKLHQPLTHFIVVFFRSVLNNSFPVRSLKIDFGEET